MHLGDRRVGDDTSLGGSYLGLAQLQSAVQQGAAQYES